MLRQLSRLAAAGVAICLVGACAGDPPTVTPAPPTADPSTGPTLDPSAAPLTVEVVNSELALGSEERVSFRLKDASGQPVRDRLGPTGQPAGEVAVAVEFYQDMPQEKPTASGPGVFFGGGLPDGGAWVVYAPLEVSGTWTMRVRATRPDGWHGEAQVPVEVIGRTATPRLGQVPPTGDTPKLEPGGDIAKLTGDARPDAALYALSVDEARTSGKPTVVYFGSSSRCPTEQCRAVLEEVKAVKATYGDRVNAIHVETHDPANLESLTAAAQAWGIGSGPWLFLLDKRGLVTARIEGGTDRTELGLLVDRALSR